MKNLSQENAPIYEALERFRRMRRFWHRAKHLTDTSDELRDHDGGPASVARAGLSGVTAVDAVVRGWRGAGSVRRWRR